LVTPDIADPTLGITTNRTFWVEVMTSATTRDYFHFHAIGTDVEGNAVDFTVPLMFVSISDIGNSANQPKVIAAYNDKAKAIVERRACNIPGQKVAFAPKNPATPTDTTQHVTDWLNFIMDAARVQPALLKAVVKPASQELLAAQPTSVRLFPDYVAKGADDPANTTGVFAQIVDDAYNEFNPANPTATLGVKIAAEKAGGMATPNMAVTTLSRALGPLAGNVADAVKNNFDPTQFFPKGAAMLFGSFDLLDLFLPKPATPSGMTLENAKNADGKKRRARRRESHCHNVRVEAEVPRTERHARSHNRRDYKKHRRHKRPRHQWHDHEADQPRGTRRATDRRRDVGFFRLAHFVHRQCARVGFHPVQKLQLPQSQQGKGAGQSRS
jgi:hypothetical protein